MSDHAVGVAKTAVATAGGPRRDRLVDLPRMGDVARAMLTDGLIAFVTGDAAARVVAGRDGAADALHTIRSTAGHVTSCWPTPTTIDLTTRVLAAAHHPERTAGRVTNFYERVVFAVTGRIAQFCAPADEGLSDESNADLDGPAMGPFARAPSPSVPVESMPMSLPVGRTKRGGDSSGRLERRVRRRDAAVLPGLATSSAPQRVGDHDQSRDPGRTDDRPQRSGGCRRGPVLGQLMAYERPHRRRRQRAGEREADPLPPRRDDPLPFHAALLPAWRTQPGQRLPRRVRRVLHPAHGRHRASDGATVGQHGADVIAQMSQLRLTPRQDTGAGDSAEGITDRARSCAGPERGLRNGPTR